MLQRTIAFVIGKKEKLVLDKRSAYGKSELIALQSRFDEDGRRNEDEADGVEISVTQKFVSGAVDLVGAGAHGGVHDSAADTAILGAVIAGNHLEFGNGVGRRLGDLIRVTLIAGGVRVV